MQELNFKLSQPSGQLSVFIQGIWSASVPKSASVMRRLYAGAGNGIIFNLNGNVTIGNETLSEGVIMLPINKQAVNIVLSSGALLAGIRFHPAIGYGVLGQHFDKPILLSLEKNQLYNFYRIYSELRIKKYSESQIEALYQWLDKNLDFTNLIPSPLKNALECIEQGEIPGQLSESNELSQRQIERLFKIWLEMTPKHYQRILRIKKTILFLQLYKNVELADVAQQFGFSDQAHMTREFRSIACITPGQVCRSSAFKFKFHR